jgi:hypothetical protein
MLTLIPAYGRDYLSREAVLAAWMADKDFLESRSGKPINRPQCAHEPSGFVRIRYARFREVCRAPI